MRKNSKETVRMTIGLDLGDLVSFFHLVNEETGEVRRGNIRTNPAALKKFFGPLAPARVVLEVGAHSPWVSRLLEHLGFEVIVAQAGRVRMIYQNHHKTDVTDAELLCRLGRVDPVLLAPIDHRPEQLQADLAVLRSRDVLVAARTKLVNSIRGQVKAYGGRLPQCSADCLHLRASLIPEPLRAALYPLLLTIGEMTRQIRALNKTLQKLADERYPVVALFQQIPGVGLLTALAFVLVLQDPLRFPKSRTVGAFLGLTPRKDQSGARDPQLGITHHGDSLLRRLLVQSGHYLLGPFGPDSELRRQGLALVARGGRAPKFRAVVAVARKLSVVMHRMWITGEEYRPLRPAGSGSEPGTAA